MDAFTVWKRTFYEKVTSVASAPRLYAGGDDYTATYDVDFTWPWAFWSCLKDAPRLKRTYRVSSLQTVNAALTQRDHPVTRATTNKKSVDSQHNQQWKETVILTYPEQDSWGTYILINSKWSQWFKTPVIKAPVKALRKCSNRIQCPLTDIVLWSRLWLQQAHGKSTYWIILDDVQQQLVNACNNISKT